MRNKKIIIIVTLLLLLLAFAACNNNDEFTITFDSNGGTIIDSIKVNGDTIVDIPANPTRDGYDFVNWYINEDLSTIFDENGLINDNITVYAKWSAITYNITFVPNGASAIDAITYTIETNNIVLADPSNRAGYSFSGWYDAETNGNRLESIPLGSMGNKTLYARWQAIPYTITYNNVAGATNTNLSAYNIESATINLTDAVKSGNTFLGWFDAAEGGNEVTSVASGSTGNIVLYARWEYVEYTISYFNYNGVNPNQTLTYNIASNTINIIDVNKDGYTFLGWFNQEVNGTEITSIPTGSTGNVTLYARWELIPYSVSYNHVEGATNPNPNSYNIETATIVLSDATKDGCTFLGWYDEEENGDEVNSITIGSIGNIVLYARWEVITYTISYNNLKGANNANAISYNINTDTITLLNISDDGYIFLGFYNAEQNGNLVDCIPSGSFGNKVLYAQWSIVEYTITYFNLTGINPNQDTTYTIESDTINLINVNKNGYTTLGYYTLSEGGIHIESIPNGSYGNRELYARYEIINYEISYNNTKGANNLNPLTYNVNTENIILIDIAKEGYNFLGWYDQQFAGSEVNSIPEGSTGFKELYAYWSLVTYSIEYILNDGENALTNPITYNCETVDIVLQDASKNGVDFLGWYDAEANGNKVDVIEIGTVGDIVLYAFYGQKYYLTYNNLLGATNLNPSFYSNLNPDITLLDAVRDGYTFLGWTDIMLNPVTVIVHGYETDVDLYATWEVKPYEISYSNTKNAENNNVTTYTIESEIINLLSITKDGYIFLGWYDAEVNGNPVLDIASGSFGDIEIFAYWEAIEYSISYNDELNAENNNETTYNIESDEIFILNLSKAGYNFIGWFDEEEGGNKILSITTGSFEDVELFARWEDIIYSITYFNVIGSNGNSNPPSYSVVSEDIVFTDLTKNGFTFCGWFDINDTEIFEILSGSTGNVTLYAHWEIVNYTITYNDEQDATNNNPTSYTVESETFNLDNLSIDGYTFTGWYTEGGAPVLSVLSGSIGNMVLFAHWNIDSYTITYHGVDGANNPNEEATYNVETEIVFEDASKDGYDFAGWYDAENNGNPIIEILEGSHGNINLYARWDIITYYITYGGVDGANNPNVITYTIISDTIDLFDAVKAGYTFDGWYNDEIEDYIESIPCGSIGDITINATWQINNYTITYNNLNGATNPNESVSYNIESGEIVFLDAILNGSDFYGWYDATLGDYRLSIPSGNIGNITLFADWGYTIYTISYFNIEGATNPNIVESFIIDTPTIDLLNASKDGYSFSGWFSEEIGGQLILHIPCGSNHNYYLYARWELEIYEINYNEVEFATNPNVTEFSITTADITLLAAVKEGYTFEGWVDGSDNPVTTIEQGSIGDITLYATWEAILYTITYINTKEADNSNPTSYDIESEVTLLSIEKEGYDFLGWFSEATGGTEIEVIDIGNTINVILYAQWNLKNYTIAYNNTKDAENTNPISYTIETLTISLNAIAEDGYIFSGWYDAEEDGNLVGSITIGSVDNVILYAYWNLDNFSITYNNTKDAENTNPISYTIETLTINLSAIAADGYTFSGWYNEEVGGDLIGSIAIGSVGNVVLYAHWSIIGYDITYFEIEGATHSNVTEYNIETETIVLLAAEKEGYTFNGWEDGDNDPVTTIEQGSFGDIELYATWELTQFTITYNNTAEANNPNPVSYNIETPSFDLVDATKENFVLSGWFDAAEGGNKIISINIGTTGNIILFAIWVQSYAITYELNGGTNSEENPESYMPNESVVIEAPYKDNYYFDGWYTEFDPEWSGRTTQIQSGATGSKTFYAKWLQATEGLAYTLINDGTEYRLSGAGTFVSNQFNTTIIIASSISGKKVTEIGEAALTSATAYYTRTIYIPSGVTIIRGAAFKNTMLRDVIIGDNSNLNVLGDSAFWNCSYMFQINIPERVTTIGQYAFLNCGQLKSVIITESVVNFSTNVFDGCPLVNILCEASELPATWNASWNNNNRPVVWDCNNNSVATDNDSYFFDDENNFYRLVYGENELSIDDDELCLVYNSNYKQTVLVLPSTVLIDTNSYPLKVLGDYSFSYYELTEITLPVYLTKIGRYAFNGTNLSLLNFADSDLVTIDECAFYNCNLIGDIVLPSTVSSINAQAFYRNRQIRSITLPENLITIGGYAFRDTFCVLLAETEELPIGWGANWNYENNVIIWDCNNSEVGTDGNTYIFASDNNTYTLKDGIASFKRYCGTEEEFAILETIMYNSTEYNVEKIGINAFYYNITLDTVTIHNGITTIDEKAFYGCYISEIIFEANSSLTSIGNSSFQNDSYLTNIVLPASLTTIGNFAFSATGIVEIVIPENVTSMGNNVFNGCTLLESVTFSSGINLNTISEHTFYSCPKLISVDIPDGVSTINSYAFYNCPLLSSVTIPLSVTTILTFGFYSCSNLTISCESLSKPAGWNTEWNYHNRPVIWDYKNQDSTFFGEDGNLYLLEMGEDSESSLDDVLTLVSYLSVETTFTMPNVLRYEISYPVKIIEADAFKNRTTLTSITIGAGVTDIGNYAFSGCTGLTTLTFSCTALATIGEYAFNNCTNITSALYISASVTSIGKYAFSYCEKISGITFAEGSLLTIINEYTFNNCIAANNLLTIPANVVTIYDDAFYNCENITGLVFAPGSVLAHIYADVFSQCTDLTGALDLPDTVNYLSAYAFYFTNITSVTIPAGLSTIGAYCFKGCEYLTTVTFDAGSTLSQINSEAFQACISLTSISIPSSTNNITIFNNAFNGCALLSNVTLSNQVKNLLSGAFMDCALTSITLPASLTGIGSNVFNGNAITSIYVPSTVLDLGENAFGGITATINCQILETNKPAYAVNASNLGFTGWHNNFAGGNEVVWGYILP